jgi:hypothetical protein
MGNSLAMCILYIIEIICLFRMIRLANIKIFLAARKFVIIRNECYAESFEPI